MKNAFSNKIVSVLLFFVLPAVACAQGVLRGTVIDSVSGDALVGAHVFLVGTSIGAATDLDGTYQISSIPAGDYSAKVSYIGYKDKVYKMKITKETNRLDARLVPDVVQGEEVIVTAQRRGQNAAINQQITSSTIVNVVSEEKIKELPDANAAEAIGRLPGVSLTRSGGEAQGVILRGMSSKFTNITVDGVKVPPTDANSRDVDLSMMSQGSLAGIEVSKALTPDKDGDAIAGAINMVTKKAPSERTITADAKGSYNFLMKSAKQFDFQIQYGERFFNDVLGVQVQGSAEKKIRSKENIDYDYDLTKTTSFDTTYKNSVYSNGAKLSSLKTTFTDEDRTRNGGKLILDINTPDNGSIKFSTMYSETERDIFTHTRGYGLATAEMYSLIYEYSEKKISTMNLSLQGQNHIATMDVDWGVSFAQSKTKNPYDFTLNFKGDNGVVTGLEWGGVGATNLAPLDIKNQITNRVIIDYTSANLYQSTYKKQENYDKEQTANINLLKNYSLGDNITGELKGGGKYKYRNRWMNAFESDQAAMLYVYWGAADQAALQNSRFKSFVGSSDGTLAYLSNFLDYPVASHTYDDGVLITPLMNKDALQTWYSLFKNVVSNGTPAFLTSINGEAGDYNVTEKINAEYLMNTFHFGQVATLLAGVRIEHENDDYNGKYVPDAMGLTSNVAYMTSIGVLDTLSKHTETTVLPNVQFNIKPIEGLNLRFAAYKAYAKPDFNLRMPTFYMTKSSGDFNLVAGSQDLMNMTAWNFESNTQWFNNTIGLIGFSAYYKVIDNYIHTTNNITLDRGYFNALSDEVNFHIFNPTILSTISSSTSIHTTIPYNDKDKSYIWGFEFEHQIGLSFLPGYLSNLNLSYNFSITKSITHIVVGKSFQTTYYDTTYNKLTGKISSISSRIVTTNCYGWEKRVSEGQPETYGNVALGYDLGGFSGRISMYYQGKYTKSYSSLGQSDIVMDKYTKFDLALKQEVVKNIFLFLNINNITNQKETISTENTVTVQGIKEWSAPYSSEFYGRTMDLGVRVII